MRRILAVCVLIVGISWGEIASSPSAIAQSARTWESAAFLPPDIPIVVDLRDLGDRWREVEASSAFRRAIEIPGIRASLAGEQFRNVEKGQKFIEGLIGKPLPDLLQDISQDGATLAWKSKKDVALLFKPSDETFARIRQTLKEFSAAAALSSKGQSSELFATKYRGVDAYGIEKARIAFCDGWVVVCSANDLGKAILDRLLGDKIDSLASTAWFQSAAALAQSVASHEVPPPTATALIDLATLRASGQFKTAPRGVDPGLEIILGGIFDAVQASPVLVASATLRETSATLHVTAQHAPHDTELSHYFYGESGLESAPPPIELSHRILSGRWHRDLGLFWKMAPQIIHDENALAGIAKSESDISTLLGGMITVGDLFQYIGPDLEFIAVKPEALTGDAKPSIVIPAFCFTGSLRDRAKAQPAFRLAFQQVASFANLNASNGMYPPLEVTTEKENGRTVISASYFVMDRPTAVQPGGDLYLNFSPTLGFFGDRFVLASQRSLAEQVMAASLPEMPSQSPSMPVDNTVLELWPAELAAAGEAAREPIIAQRLLTTGQDRESVAADVDTFLALLRQFDSARLRLRADERTVTLEFETHLVQEAAKAPER